MFPEINEETTHGNLGLERFLRALVHTFQPPFVPGNIYVVMNAADEAYVQYYKDHNRIYEDGTEVIQTTLAAAYAAMASNRNDVVLLNGHGTHSLAEMLDVAKNRCHFYGMSDRRRYGHAARVSIGETSAVTDIAAIKNTGVRNSFKNFKVMSANTLTEGLFAFAEGGEYTVMEDVELYLSAQLAVAGAAELLMNGDSFQGKRITLGSNVDIITANGARPNILLDRETITGKVCRDVTIEDSLFWRKSADVDNRFVYGSGATDVERMLLLKDCIFHNTKLAAQTMALAVHTASEQSMGRILLKNCESVGVAGVATQTGIFVDNGAATAGKGGFMIQAVAQ